MTIDINDINYHSLTKSEARDIQQELDSEYGTLEKFPVKSNVRSTFFENHWILIGSAALIFVSSMYKNNLNVSRARRDFGYLI